MPLPAALGGFRFRSEIDWIKLRVTLTRPSQFRHVQDRLKEKFGKLFVEPCDGCASSRRFDITIHNPAGATQVMRDLQNIVRPSDPLISEADVQVVGIEVAIDAYIKGSDRARLTAAVGHFVRHLARTPAGPMRLTSPNHFRVPATYRDLLQAISSDQTTIHFGAKEANFRVRAYFKDYDTIEGKRKNLLSVQHRARIEITLHGEQLPFRSIDSWRNFRFEQLSDRFAMCTPVATNGIAGALQDRAVQIGRAEDAPKRRPSDRRKRSPFTQRDSVTNDKIRQALRGLTARQSCLNSVKTSTKIAALSEGEIKISPDVLNTLMGSASAPLPQSVMSSSEQGQFNDEIDSLLDRLEEKSRADEFDTPLPETGGPGSLGSKSCNVSPVRPYHPYAGT